MNEFFIELKLTPEHTHRENPFLFLIIKLVYNYWWKFGKHRNTRNKIKTIRDPTNRCYYVSESPWDLFLYTCIHLYYIELFYVTIKIFVGQHFSIDGQFFIMSVNTAMNILVSCHCKCLALFWVFFVFCFLLSLGTIPVLFILKLLTFARLENWKRCKFQLMFSLPFRFTTILTTAISQYYIQIWENL